MIIKLFLKERNKEKDKIWNVNMLDAFIFVKPSFFYVLHRNTEIKSDN